MLLWSSVNAVRPREASDGMRFFTIGDWGGIKESPYTTHAEIAVAGAMDLVAQSEDPAFIVALGDNFYDAGIPTDEYSTRFKDTFEQPFNATSLQIPWYITSGNHDHIGNVTAQIEYSKHSKRWNYPELWYLEQFEFTDSGKKFKVDLIMFDSVVLSGDSYEHDQQPVDPLTGESINVKGPEDEVLADAQWTFIETALNTSTADFLFVAGHYPVWSVCSHGPTKKLRDIMRPMMENVNVTAFLSGHDHCMGHFEYNNMVYALSGAGHGCCYDNKHEDKVPAGAKLWSFDASTQKIVHPGEKPSGGFNVFDLTADGAIITYYDDLGYAMYRSRLIPPRGAA